MQKKLKQQIATESTLSREALTAL